MFNISEYNIEDLLAMLTYRRPKDSLSEQQFIERFLLPHGPISDTWGNLYLNITAGEKQSRTMFSCHVDTVHRNGDRQQIQYDSELLVISKDDKEPLGADDGAGIWIMLEMFKAGVPGTYVFHRGEESGGIGSRAAAAGIPDFFKNYDRCIAFDRAGDADVITHQGAQRCCSDEFAEALSKALNEAEGSTFKYKPCDGGVFTDSKSYVGLIPECTNLSVGYEAQHGPNEIQDVEHLAKLLEACLKIDFESLPVKRDPTKTEYKTYKHYNYSPRSHAGWGDDEWGYYGGRGVGGGGMVKSDPPSTTNSAKAAALDEKKSGSNKRKKKQKNKGKGDDRPIIGVTPLRFRNPTFLLPEEIDKLADYDPAGAGTALRCFVRYGLTFQTNEEVVHDLLSSFSTAAIFHVFAWDAPSWLYTTKDLKDLLGEVGLNAAPILAKDYHNLWHTIYALRKEREDREAEEKAKLSAPTPVATRPLTKTEKAEVQKELAKAQCGLQKIDQVPTAIALAMQQAEMTKQSKSQPESTTPSEHELIVDSLVEAGDMYAEALIELADGDKLIH